MTTENKKNDRTKIIERVRALLAMGSDASSPHEAGIALARARKLMDKHQVSTLDIENCIEDDFGTNQFASGFAQKKTWIGILAVAMANLNGCVVKIAKRTDRKQKISYEFSGFEEDGKMCEFMMVYLTDAANMFYNKDRVAYGLNGTSDKNSYLVGFSNGIVKRVKEIIAEREAINYQQSTSTSLVVAKKALVQSRFGTTKTKPSRRITAGNGHFLGGQAADKAHLGGFMDNHAPERARIS